MDVYIRFLRSKIDEAFDLKLISTVRGVGYVIRDENKQEKVHTIGFSLVSKLNIQLWFRLVGTFIMLNLVFLAASGITLGVLGERRAAQAVQQIQAFGLPASAESAWLSSQGLEIRAQDCPPRGFCCPPRFGALSPGDQRCAADDQAAPRTRCTPVQYPGQPAVPLPIEVDGTPVTIVIHFASAIRDFEDCFPGAVNLAAGNCRAVR